MFATTRMPEGSGRACQEAVSGTKRRNTPQSLGQAQSCLCAGSISHLAALETLHVTSLSTASMAHRCERASTTVQLGKVTSTFEWSSHETQSPLRDVISFLAGSFDFQSSA